jgi:hypothetical protein
MIFLHSLKEIKRQFKAVNSAFKVATLGLTLAPFYL